MPDRLLIRLASDGDLAWLRQTADGRLSARAQIGAPPASVVESSDEVIVFVPTEEVLLLETRVAARNASQRLKAVPFAIEDQLLGSVEDQHFAIAPGTGDQIGVAVVSRTRLQGWLAVLAAAGVRPDVLTPESLALPVIQNAASVLLEDQRALVRLAEWSAFACPRADLDAWLERTRDGAESRRVEIHASTLCAEESLHWFADHVDSSPLNLLSGEFAAGHRQARGSRWWRRAIVLAAVVVLATLANRALEVAQLSRSAERIEAAMADSVLRTFPDLGAAERTRAPQNVMRDRLERLRGGSEATGLLRLLGQIAPSLGTTTRTQTRGMEYRNGILELGLRTSDVATLDNMREQFAAIPGLSAEVTAANPVDNGVDGRIRISGATP